MHGETETESKGIKENVYGHPRSNQLSVPLYLEMDSERLRKRDNNLMQSDDVAFRARAGSHRRLPHQEGWESRS